LGINLNGNPISVITASVTPEWDDGNVWTAWINYRRGQLDVYASQQPVPPATPMLGYAIDIPGLLGQDTAYVGLTAGTGS
jgi:hypothetical protein